jgi:hypothetical protein
VTKKNIVFWNVKMFGSCKNRRFGELSFYKNQVASHPRRRHSFENLITKSENLVFVPGLNFQQHIYKTERNIRDNPAQAYLRRSLQTGHLLAITSNTISHAKGIYIHLANRYHSDSEHSSNQHLRRMEFCDTYSYTTNTWYGADHVKLSAAVSKDFWLCLFSVIL